MNIYNNIEEVKDVGQITGSSIINGDCLDVMKYITDKSVDCIICDLPYGTTACSWDSIIPFEPLWEQYKRVIKDNGAIVLFGSQPFTSALIMSNPKMFKYDIIWNKKSTTGFLNSKKMQLRQHEEVLIFSNSKMGNFTYNPIMRIGKMRVKGGLTNNNKGVYQKHQSFKSINDSYYPTSIIEISNADQKNKVHPTQKPVALIEYLIKTYSNEEDIILDNTMGSGTTCVASINTNRKFIGIEKDENYFTIAKNRIEEKIEINDRGLF
jgi:site-specific DNA-methyltransferase (adenine-specific)